MATDEDANAMQERINLLEQRASLLHAENIAAFETNRELFKRIQELNSCLIASESLVEKLLNGRPQNDSFGENFHVKSPSSESEISTTSTKSPTNESSADNSFASINTDIRSRRQPSSYSSNITSHMNRFEVLLDEFCSEFEKSDDEYTSPKTGQYASPQFSLQMTSSPQNENSRENDSRKALNDSRLVFKDINYINNRSDFSRHNHKRTKHRIQSPTCLKFSLAAALENCATTIAETNAQNRTSRSTRDGFHILNSFRKRSSTEIHYPKRNPHRSQLEKRRQRSRLPIDPKLLPIVTTPTEVSSHSHTSSTTSKSTTDFEVESPSLTVSNRIYHRGHSRYSFSSAENSPPLSSFMPTYRSYHCRQSSNTSLKDYPIHTTIVSTEPVYRFKSDRTESINTYTPLNVGNIREFEVVSQTLKRVMQADDRNGINKPARLHKKNTPRNKPSPKYKFTSDVEFYRSRVCSSVSSLTSSSEASVQDCGTLDSFDSLAINDGHNMDSRQTVISETSGFNYSKFNEVHRTPIVLKKQSMPLIRRNISALSLLSTHSLKFNQKLPTIASDVGTFVLSPARNCSAKKSISGTGSAAKRLQQLQYESSTTRSISTIQTSLENTLSRVSSLFRSMFSSINKQLSGTIEISNEHSQRYMDSDSNSNENAVVSLPVLSPKDLHPAPSCSLEDPTPITGRKDSMRLQHNQNEFLRASTSSSRNHILQIEHHVASGSNAKDCDSNKDTHHSFKGTGRCHMSDSARIEADNKHHEIGSRPQIISAVLPPEVLDTIDPGSYTKRTPSLSSSANQSISNEDVKSFSPRRISLTWMNIFKRKPVLEDYISFPSFPSHHRRLMGSVDWSFENSFRSSFSSNLTANSDVQTNIISNSTSKSIRRSNDHVYCSLIDELSLEEALNSPLY
ncbi:hypothetical protein V1511DRAFT_508708 [Dipodascopsis uninucleata]